MRIDLKDIKNLLGEFLEKESLIFASLSSPLSEKLITKIDIRPITLQGKLNYQITKNYPQKALHENVAKEHCLKWVVENIAHFKQTFFYTKEADYHLLVGKKGRLTLLKKAPSKISCQLPHNRQKEYLLPEGVPIPFLVHLGIMNSAGRVFPAKKDKFRQINRFLEMLNDILSHIDTTKKLQIIDFGCGKAYLTFAIYHFLKFSKGYSVHLTGLDIKREVITFCENLTKALGYEDELEFIQADINTFEVKENIDLMVSLHACDTATDAALEKAIHWKTQAILCVPCCQHELMKQIQQKALNPLLKHGILRERIAALATDAARVQLLEILGYHTQILEFIDAEHTPKNLLIRGIKHPISHFQQKIAWQEYLEFKKTLNINPSLERRFEPLLMKI